MDSPIGKGIQKSFVLSPLLGVPRGTQVQNSSGKLCILKLRGATLIVTDFCFRFN